MNTNTIWGWNAVHEALQTHGRVNRLYLARDTKVKRVEELVALCKALGAPFDFIPQAKLNEITGTRDHQGVAATISPVDYVEIDALLNTGGRSCIVVLDEVQHPKNLGMIIRAVAAAGADGLVVPVRGGASLDETVVRSSAGTVFRVPIARCNNVAQTLRGFKDAGFWIYGLDGAAGDDIYTCSWGDRVVLVMGNESAGLRPGVRNACDALLRIPLSGGVESLNVAVAAGVALFEIRRSRLASDHSGNE
jgi:23S rRNA (guanosine2251-2'-O)-methyltransferase